MLTDLYFIYVTEYVSDFLMTCVSTVGGTRLWIVTTQGRAVWTAFICYIPIRNRMYLRAKEALTNTNILIIDLHPQSGLHP